MVWKDLSKAVSVSSQLVKKVPSNTVIKQNNYVSVEDESSKYILDNPLCFNCSRVTQEGLKVAIQIEPECGYGYEDESHSILFCKDCLLMFTTNLDYVKSLS